MDSTITLYISSGILALVPAAIWLSVIFKKTKRRLLQLIIFLTGTLTVIPIFAMQYFLNLFPQFSIVNFLQENINNQNLNYIFLFISVGITEEIVKQAIIRFIDKRYLLIETINESIQFSLVSALGFSFIENIFYIYHIWTNLGVQQLFVAYLFRSIFTTCAHLIFSGIFGYYYGIAKFSLDIREQSEIAGQKHYFQNALARIFNYSKSEAFKETTILKGLSIAILFHAIFDFLLQLNQIIPVVIFVCLGYGLLRLLLKQKTGRLVLINDIDNMRQSSMAKSDEDVVIELLGMWFKDKKYVDVIHICERLLERDPDNKVVQLFKSRAIDSMNNNSIYAKILGNLFPKNSISISKLIKLKEKKD